jgi:ornithine cyclodeaminase/alanine dehydrogenase-like protein (mu-crystallin family)
MWPGRTSPDEITCFKSLGIAIEDLAAAELAIANAAADDIGTVAPW